MYGVERERVEPNDTVSYALSGLFDLAVFGFSCAARR